MNLLNKIKTTFSGTQSNATMEFAKQVANNKKLLIDLALTSENLTKKDIKTWRNAWQAALDIENPNRLALYGVYTDVLIDLHLSGCLTQRKGETQQKPFVLIDAKGKENIEAKKIFESTWFIDFVDHALDSRYWGHSLIQLGDIDRESETMGFTNVELVDRRHVVPEYGVIVREAGDDPKNGISYREGEFLNWCIEAGGHKDLGLLLKCAPQALSKKNMLAYWDTFGEVFGMPIRIAKTISQDKKEHTRIEKMLAGMGAAPYGLFPAGTEIELKETSRGDAYNVYDKRIDRCNSEMSKGALAQTMTIDDGSSLSQSATHLEIFKKVCASDALMVKHLVNGDLIPLMIKHGFPLKGVYFDWDKAANYTPAEQREQERLLMQEYDIDPQYFIDKYKIPILGRKKPDATTFFR